MGRAKSVEPQTELLETERAGKSTALVAHDPESLMALAISKGGPQVAEAIERLTRLRIELEDRNDRKALFTAISKAKASFPKFEKSRTYDVMNAAGGKVRSGEYAPLEEMMELAKPVLEENGLFVTYGQRASTPGMVRATCTVTHANGQSHSEGFDVTTESKAGMSPQQKYSAATSFAMRCAFMLLFGIVPSLPETIEPEFDHTPVSEDQAATLGSLLDEVNADRSRFLAYFGVEGLSALPVRRYNEAVAMLEQKRRKA